ncbi:uncharacterized protein LOC101851983, partial [Aplysia californica]|uniref:Uncharacterized protein LOC101851983 n=1 Tax=Aplysia californica TaxID=6500 RepID=A0ABM1A994_APLCA
MTELQPLHTAIQTPQKAKDGFPFSTTPKSSDSSVKPEPQSNDVKLVKQEKLQSSHYGSEDSKSTIPAVKKEEKEGKSLTSPKTSSLGRKQATKEDAPVTVSHEDASCLLAPPPAPLSPTSPLPLAAALSPLSSP